MRPPKIVLPSSLVLAGIMMMTPSVAIAAPNGTNRPLTGTLTVTTTVNLATGAATNVTSGLLSQLGKASGTSNEQFSIPSPNEFAWTGTGTITAANGDQLFEAISGTGTFGPPMESTRVDTVTGGTGRFADASGTFTYTSVPGSGSVSVAGSIETVILTSTIKGTISY